MAFLSSMNITGSALTAQQLRLDVISENVANINTTRVEGEVGPYQRKMVVMEADGGRDTFRQALAQAAGNVPGKRIIYQNRAVFVSRKSWRILALLSCNTIPAIRMQTPMGMLKCRM